MVSRRPWLVVIRVAGVTGYTWHESRQAAWAHGETVVKYPLRLHSRDLREFDSAMGVGTRGRYSIMVWRPEADETCDECGRPYAEAPLPRAALVEQLRAELAEALADADRMRVACSLYGVGVDPDGNYPGTPGTRARQLLHLEKAARVLVGSLVGNAAVYPERIQDLIAAVAAVDALAEGVARDG